MQIIAQFTGEVSAQFQNVVNAAINYYDNLIKNNLTISIPFSEQWLDGSLSASLSMEDTYSYDQVKAALTTNASSALQRRAYAALPDSSPFGSSVNVPVAEALMLGLDTTSDTTNVGTVYFDPNHSWNYAISHTAVPGTLDALGAIEHEISEVLGRQLGSDGDVDPTVLALFRYSALGQIDTSSSAGGYFSVDGRMLDAPMGEQGGDLADWPNFILNDSYGDSTAGEVGAISPLDLKVLNLLGYNLNASTDYNYGMESTVDLSYASTAKNNILHYIDGLNYIASFNDLIQVLGANSAAGDAHFITSGIQEGRVTTFDGLNYVASYSDLTSFYRGLGFGKVIQDAGATHFINYGYNEGRKTTFNGLDYIASYGDLIEAFGADNDLGAQHYISCGSIEGRKVTFNGLDYIASYSDLINLLGANEQAGAAQFINSGAKEGRKTTFDGLDYIASYSDLMTAFGANDQAGATHFIDFGAKEGRSSSLFDPNSYLSAHSDLIGKYATTDAFLAAYITTYQSTGRYLT